MAVEPTLTTQAVTGVTPVACTGHGTITDTGGVNATLRGFCYMTGTVGDPTVANHIRHESGDFGAEAYDLAISGLTPSTNYRVRAYAINMAGTAYGDTVQMATLAANNIVQNLITRASKGAPLTSTELDLDLVRLGTAIGDLDGGHNHNGVNSRGVAMPTIIFGTGAPPSPTGLDEGTIYVKYI